MPDLSGEKKTVTSINPDISLILNVDGAHKTPLMGIGCNGVSLNIPLRLEVFAWIGNRQYEKIWF